jgi:HEAT repeat protein
MMTIAIDGLAALDSKEASDSLRRMVRDVGEPSQLRLAAARALGQLHETGLVDLARELSGIPSQPDALHPLLATQLLDRHVDPGAIALFQELLNNDNTAVHSESLGRLYRIDFNLVEPHCERFITSPDYNVRRWCLLTLVDTQRADHIDLICQLLNDVNPSLRRSAADSLVQLARDAALEEVIIEETGKVLSRDDWQGCEQACVVLTKLDHRPSGPRMVELLGHQRGEVQVAAAWGLTKLRIEELLPDMLDHAQSVYEGFRSGALNDKMPGVSLHIAHLFIAFGDQTYQAAEPLMRKYIPKDHSLGLESRAAAAWALGLLHEGDADSDLIPIFVGRLYDNDIDPDTYELRSMCAISLGRMMAESALPDLRKHASASMPACHWAIERMTGEKPPKVTYEATMVDDWFLTPIDSRSESR